MKQSADRPRSGTSTIRVPHTLVVAVGVSPFTYLPVTAVRIEESHASDLDLDDLARQATEFLRQDLGLTSSEGVERALTLFIGGRLAPTRYRHTDIMATALEVS